jgi:hypothetical protein
MDFERERRKAHDEIYASALIDAAGSLLDDLFDRILRSDERVTSAAEGKRLLQADDDLEQLTDRIQRLVALATPVLRTLARGARFTRVPWVLVGTSAVSAATTVRAGLNELRVLASLIAYRLEAATGEPADGRLVRKLALELYLHPRREPDVSDLRLPVAKLLRRWLTSGVLGRDTRKGAERSLDAAERLDVEALTLARAPVER